VVGVAEVEVEVEVAEVAEAEVEVEVAGRKHCGVSKGYDFRHGKSLSQLQAPEGMVRTALNVTPKMM
jgi:hypothetical protein